MTDGDSAEHELELTRALDSASVLAKGDRELLRLISIGRRVPTGGEGEKLVAAGLAQDQHSFLALTEAGGAALRDLGCG